MMPTTYLFIILAIVCSSIATTADAFTAQPSPSKTKYNRNIAAAFAPTPSDFADAPSILLAKLDTKSAVLSKSTSAVPKANTDLAVHVLTDASHALMDFPSIFKSREKHSKLRMQYANVLGRVLILVIGLLPHHGYSPEELTVQLFLLGTNMKPVIRSIQLFRCISAARCAEECLVELGELDESLPN